MIVIVGKTASGKDTVVNKLVAEHGFSKILTYTTRPMRPMEEDGKTYHFISEDEFLNKVKSGFFFEWKSYSTGMGVWYYGSANEDIIGGDKPETVDRRLIILTPKGYMDLIDKLGYTPKSIYLYANNKTMKLRLAKRGDNKDEIYRRVKTDNEEFNGVADMVDKIVYNNHDNDLESVVENICKIVEKWEEEAS